MTAVKVYSFELPSAYLQHIAQNPFSAACLDAILLKPEMRTGFIGAFTDNKTPVEHFFYESPACRDRALQYISQYLGSVVCSISEGMVTEEFLQEAKAQIVLN